MDLGVQRQFGTDLMVSATYMGNQAHICGSCAGQRGGLHPGRTVHDKCGRHLQPLLDDPNTNQRRALHLENPREVSVHGILDVQETAARRATTACCLRAATRGARPDAWRNYTWSHCISDNTSLGTNRRPRLYLSRSQQPDEFDRGNCESIGATASPDGVVRNSGGFPRPRCARSRADGVSPDLSQHLRQLHGVLASGSSAQRRRQSRAEQVLGDPYLDRDGLNFLNPAAFAQPALGSLGNMLRNNIDDGPLADRHGDLAASFRSERRGSSSASRPSTSRTG